MMGCMAISTIFAQTKQIEVKWIDEPIRIDGILNDPAWFNVAPSADFWQYFPTDSLPSTFQTEIRMLYDEKYLYVSAIMYAPDEKYIVPSLRRDFRAGGNDNISFMFDTFNDGNNAFLFGSNPEGVQREALISGGGIDNSGFRTTWDVKWENASKVEEEYWVLEFRIPFASLKFKEGSEKWRFNAYRFDTQSNERSIWNRIPQQFNMTNLAFMGEMIFERPLGKSRTPFAVIPYIAGNVTPFCFMYLPSLSLYERKQSLSPLRNKN